ncbi:MAG: efflux RND transporter periplasmic adaptor subunit [Planctomycetota bacterium]|jgi:RND family efflux transporter MFP subunit
MVKRIILSLALIVLVLGAAAAISRVMLQNPPKPPERDEVLPPPLVRTIYTRPETVTEKIVGYGTARAYRSATLTAEVSGEVLKIAPGLQDGSPVIAEQVLVHVDDRRYVQTLEQKTAQSAVAAARLHQLDVEEANLSRLLAITNREVQVTLDEERRLAQLFEEDHASKREYDIARLAYTRSLRERTDYQNRLDLIAPQGEQLQASLRGSRAEVEFARLDVEHCRIPAPFDGRIDELAVEVGETVQRGGTVATVIDGSRIEVPIELPASAYARTRLGATVDLRTDSGALGSGLQWPGTVERISPDADEESRTFRAYVVVDNRAQQTPLVPGYFLRAEVTGPTLVDVLLVPRGSIVADHVFVLNDGRAHGRRVEIQRYLGDRAVVTGELNGGESVIVTNLDVLEEGTLVRVGDPSNGP